jgi:hypothetical protein
MSSANQLSPAALSHAVDTKAKAGEILKPDGGRYKPSVLRTYASDLDR